MFIVTCHCPKASFNVFAANFGDVLRASSCRVWLDVGLEPTTLIQKYLISGADPGCLERAFIGIKVWGSLCCFYHFFLKYPENEIIWSLRTNYFIFIGYYTRRREGWLKRTPSGSATGYHQYREYLDMKFQ